MSFPDYKAERVVREQIEDRLRAAEARCASHRAGLDQRGWLSRQLCRLIGSLGGMLVVLGRRLERYEAPSMARAVERGRTSEASPGG
jgi:hypothetical protein